MNLKAIVAVAANNVIGNGLHIPWHIKEDFKHFKETTLGSVIVFGKSTWLSLGCKPLPGRENAILSTTLTGTPPEGALYFKSKDALLDHYKNDPRTVWICGGAKIYEEFLPLCSELIMSKIKKSYEGDILFPDISPLFTEQKTLKSFEEFSVIRYVKK